MCCRVQRTEKTALHRTFLQNAIFRRGLGPLNYTLSGTKRPLFSPRNLKKIFINSQESALCEVGRGTPLKLTKMGSELLFLAWNSDIVVLKPSISHFGFNLNFLYNYPNDKC